MYLNGKRKRSIQNRMYPWKNKILICMDFTFITHLYNLAFSKHFLAYSLTCLYCAILFLSCILMLRQNISSHIYLFWISSWTSLCTISQFLSMPNRLVCALRTQNKKRMALCNCLAIYEGPFHTWWNTNYLAHVQKQSKQKRYQQIKHGPGDRTQLGIASQSQCEELGHLEHECEVIRLHWSQGLWLPF